MLKKLGLNGLLILALGAGGIFNALGNETCAPLKTVSSCCCAPDKEIPSDCCQTKKPACPMLKAVPDSPLAVIPEKSSPQVQLVVFARLDIISPPLFYSRVHRLSTETQLKIRIKELSPPFRAPPPTNPV